MITPSTSPDRIVMTISAEPSLGRVVRVAMLFEGRALGMTQAQAGPFARAVEKAFREAARRPARARQGAIRLSIEPGRGVLRARIDGRGRPARTYVLRPAPPRRTTAAKRRGARS